MEKYKVKLCAGGPMGLIARSVIDSLPNVESVGIHSNDFDVLFSASFPERIPQSECKIAALCAVNIHTGLLPEGRGSNPLNWALIWGKQKTGITIHKIVDSFDAGDIVLQQEVPIYPADNIVELRKRVEFNFPQVIRDFFGDVEGFLANARKQNQSLASYAQKRRPEDSELNMNAPAKDTYNLFRSCDPVHYPAFFLKEGVKHIVDNILFFANGSLSITSHEAV